ncbi:MAG: hypothetical protein Q7J20_10605 [Candidatus Nitrotoga sp.]|nr:hypothetical protein [Candidatus Nitrotoga sp.]MDO9448318.1 hypothetical protein [Candidatus Nitrotoga sp.]MDP3498187.1 hypothetical protein [Candidatus Nitrotoga sp.]
MQLGCSLGIGASVVARIWQIHGLKPHRVVSFKLSNVYTQNLRTLSACTSIYPGTRWCCIVIEKKHKFRHLTLRSLTYPLSSADEARTNAHDYKYNAALNTLDGKVLSMTDPLYRHQGWLKFFLR